MQYMILQWNQDKMEWKVIHYTHNFDDFEIMALKYPMPEYVHMINVNYIQANDIFKRAKAFKEKCIANGSY